MLRGWGAVKGAEGDGPQSPVSRTFSLSLVLTRSSCPPCWLSQEASSFSMRPSQSARSSWAVPRRDEASRVCPSRCMVSALLWPTMRYRILRDSIFSCASWASSPVAAPRPASALLRLVSLGRRTCCTNAFPSLCWSLCPDLPLRLPLPCFSWTRLWPLIPTGGKIQLPSCPPLPVRPVPPCP